ncbi:type III-B CRISPR-associated protein Cas10/Cmr2 [Sulfurihydrogenibium sp.]|uniref:type III-B CRISPR-associated protein Cas10/Cmr2 n=1 Tax=Sulfurihydrogenibium sp. TaxID=2053621 RepID=UPI0026024BC7|nr:type III-B CRISPR-associated protein Cas10/Cmr2 [Sulfurihydrogenibium sp.]
MREYLVKLTIPSVQELITQSRKLIDLYGGSSLIPSILSQVFKKFVNNQQVDFLIPTKEVIENHPENITNVAYIVYKSDSEEKVKNFCEELEKEIYDTLVKTLYNPLEKWKVDSYKKLAFYQIKSSIKVIYGAVEIKERLKQTKNEVDKLVAYLKGTIEPDSTVIEGVNLYEKENNLYFEKDFLEFLENQKNIQNQTYPHVLGAYLCNVCGKRSIIGATPNDLKGSKFWEKLQVERYPLISESEKLCGFCLSKRIYKYKEAKIESVVNYAIREYEKDVEEKLLGILDKYHVQDTQIIYKENWEKYKIPENLKQELEDFYKDNGEPSKYYAFLMADGDSMGEKVDEAFESEVKLKAFTEKLSGYSKQFKEIVEKNRGEIVYTGGDDVLGILPKSTVLDTFEKIYDKFSETSTMSGGIVIAHYKVPLNYVLNELRKAEKTAKNKGKKGVYIKYIKHSFSSSGCFLKREEIEDFKEVVNIVSQQDFPKTFINQLEMLLKPYSTKEDLKEEKQIVENLIKYLINKKKFNNREKFEKLILKQTFEKVEDIVGKLKVAKFLAARSEV